MTCPRTALLLSFVLPLVAGGVGAQQADEAAANDRLAAKIEQRLERGVEEHAFPGAVCMVARHGEPIVKLAVGKLTYEGDEPVTLTTRYDLASLTKVCATTPAVLRLVAAGKLSLDDRVDKWVPAFKGAGKEHVTVRHLMAHQGGLSAYVRFYRSIEGKDTIVAAAAKEGLMSEPATGVRYSDLGFILLMAVVESCSGEPFEAFVQREVFAPFGMKRATFAPTDGEPIADAAPSEVDEARGGVVRGFVHDENAYAMGGVSGHAGLFAPADDILRYGIALLKGGDGVLPKELVAKATRPVGLTDDTTRGLGYQLLTSGGYGGTEIPAGTFGHTGFTGTSLWCCPERDTCVVLLTNRVYPTRVNNKITAARRDVHDLVLAAVR